MERLTKFITPVGKCMTTLNSMKHYMPCVPCRHKAQIKTDSNGKQYTEKFSFCDTCEVKMLFNRLKEYEDAEEQGLLLRLPCKVGDKVYVVGTKCMADQEPSDDWCIVHDCDECVYDKEHIMFETKATPHTLFLMLGKEDKYWIFGETVFLTKEEAEQALARMEKK